LPHFHHLTITDWMIVDHLQPVAQLHIANPIRKGLNNQPMDHYLKQYEPRPVLFILLHRIPY